MLKLDTHLLTRQNAVRNTLLIMVIAFLIAGCSGQQVVPFEPTSLLDYHVGYWVAKMKIPDQPVSLTVINDMHVDAATNRITVYAQTRLLGKVVAPPQVGPDECTESVNGDTVCFHPNAVYLNGSGQERNESSAAS